MIAAPVPLIQRRYTPPPLPRAATLTRPPVALTSVRERLAGGLDPARLSIRAGLVPDDWQADLLRSTARQVLVLCSRQVGKSTTTATLAAHTAIYEPEAPVLLLSPSLRQSGQLFAKVKWVLKRLGGDFADITTDNALSVRLANGSEIHSLPGKGGTVRGFSGVRRVIVDEAAFVSDDLFPAVTPMLAVSGGALVLLSTPFGKRGRFYEECAHHEACVRAGLVSPWEMFRVTADECPRIPEEFKAEERRKLGILYQQEYECHVAGALVGLADGTSKPIHKLAFGDRIRYNDRINNTIHSCIVKELRAMGRRSILRVTCEDGSSFRATHNHRVVSSAGKVALADALDLHYIQPVRDPGGAEEALARLVGFNMGDGTIAEREATYRRKDGTTSGKKRLQASFYSANAEDLAEVARDVVRAGLRATEPRVCFKRGLRPEYDSYQLHLNATESAALAAAGCPVGEKVTQEFSAPQWVLTGSASVQAEFLAALWGAEGATPIQSSGANSKRANAPTMSMHKRVAADGTVFFAQLATMLNGLGIGASTYARRKSDGVEYALTITGSVENTQRFYNRVGFRYAARKSLLAFQWERYYGAYRYETEARKRRAIALRATGLPYAKIAAALGCSTQQAHNLCLLSTSNPGWGFPRFREWIDARWRDGGLYVAIVEREDEPEEETYNIEVDSPDHSYLMADGLDNYNCQFLDVVMALFRHEDIARALDNDLAPYFDDEEVA